MVRAGIYLANYDTYADPAFILDVARSGARAGWDGIFLYDHVVLDEYPTIDAWTTLAAIAASVPRVTIGVLIAVPGRRHIGVLAQQAATLQKISGGRLILGLGLGEDQDYEAFGHPMDLVQRAACIQLALDVLPRLWSGHTLTGVYQASARPGGPKTAVARLERVRTGPPLDHPPRVWLGSGHRNKAAMRRAADADGIFPIYVPWDPDRSLSPEEFNGLAREAKRYRGEKPIETATTGMTQPGAMHGATRSFADLDWWLELMTPEKRSPAEVLGRVNAGP